MSRRRFFVPSVHRGIAELTGEDAEHLVRVLRAEVGQVYEISDNQHLYRAVIETARKSLVAFRIEEKLPEAQPGVRIDLFPALVKFDRFEWLLEKATELGVTMIQPFEAVRSEHGLTLASQKRSQRWNKIALEASQQSRRVRLPRIEPVVRLRDVLKTRYDIAILLDEADSAKPILDLLPLQRSSDDQVGVLLGPEGGWTDEERRSAIEAGWQPCSLGQRILRTETAATASLAILQAWWALQPNR